MTRKRASNFDVERTTQEMTKHLGVQIGTEMLRLALTHRSFSFEHGGVPTNERLEFLGDSVLGVLVTDHLYRSFPDEAESSLAKLRASVVSTFALATAARRIGIGEHIMLGQGEIRTRGADKDSILADTLEALIGASYIEGGFPRAEKIVSQHIIPLLDDDDVMGAGKDWKTLVRMVTENNGLGDPEYHINSTGPDHARSFTATLVVQGVTYATAQGGSKKEAEREAARASWPDIKDLDHAGVA